MHTDTTCKQDDWCLLPIITGSNNLYSLRVRVCDCDSCWNMPVFQISEFSSQSRSVCWQKWQFHHHHEYAHIHKLKHRAIGFLGHIYSSQAFKIFKNFKNDYPE